MSNGATVLGSQFGCQVAQSDPGLDNSNVALAERHIMHAIQLDDQVAVFSTEAKGGIAVSPRLRRHLDAKGLGAHDCSLDMLNGGGHCDGGWRVGDAEVEGRRIALPVGRPLGVDRHAGRSEPGFNISLGHGGLSHGDGGVRGW